MEALQRLIAVTCGQEGKTSITGTAADNAELQEAITELRAANEALAAMVEQMRVAVAKCRFDSLNMTFADLDYIKRAFAATDFTAASILAERDARTLRMAAEICDVHAMMATNQDGAELANSCGTAIRDKISELAKAGATVFVPGKED